MLVDDSDNKVYVANYHTFNVSVISTVSHVLFYTLPTDADPIQVLADPPDDLVMVANSLYYGTHDDCPGPCPANGTITFYSASSDALLNTVQVGVQPNSMALSPLSDDLYVANLGSSNISVISTNQERLVGSINIPSIELIADPTTGLVYSASGGISGTVSVIDSLNNTVVATVPVGSFPLGLLLDPWNGDLYVENQGSNSITIISTATNRAIAVVPVPSQPGLMTLDSTNGDVIVGCSEFSNARQFYNGTLNVISPRSNALVRSLPVSAYMYGMAEDNATGALYLLTYQNLTVFNASSVTPLYTDLVDSTAYRLAFDPAGNALYILSPNYEIGVPGVVNIYVPPPPVTVGSGGGPLGPITLSDLVFSGAIFVGVLLAAVIALKRKSKRR